MQYNLKLEVLLFALFSSAILKIHILFHSIFILNCIDNKILWIIVTGNYMQV